MRAEHERLAVPLVLREVLAEPRHEPGPAQIGVLLLGAVVELLPRAVQGE
jgi:hypothetical protein